MTDNVHGTKRRVVDADVLPHTCSSAIESVVCSKRYKGDSIDDSKTSSAEITPNMVVSGLSLLASVAGQMQQQAQLHTVVVPQADNQFLPSTIYPTKAEDMSGQVAHEGIKTCIKQCVRNNLFRDVKFYIHTDHKVYSTDSHTLCGRVLMRCHSKEIEFDAKWWENHRSLVIKAITDRRNNAIKRIKERFQGKSILVHMQFHVII